MGEDEFEESESIVESGFIGKTEVPKADLVTLAWRKCIESRAKEMRAGYYNYKTDKNGNTQKIYIEDSRKLFISSVVSFEMVLADDLDDEYIKVREKLEEEKEKCFKRFGHRIYSYKKVKDPNGYNSFIYTPNKIVDVELPEEDFVFELDESGREIKINWANNVFNYFEQLVAIYDEIYKELVKLVSNSERLDNLRRARSYG